MRKVITLASQVSFNGLEKQLKPVNRQMANQIVKMARRNIEKLIKLSEQKVAEQAAEIIAQAKVEANSKLQAELHRLEALNR